MESNNWQVHSRWFASEVLYKGKGLHALNSDDDSNALSWLLVDFLLLFLLFHLFVFPHSIRLNWNVDEKIC